MEETAGVYVMRVASMLSGMHPQTLRKYERAGFLTPSRNNSLRMYSDEDIARLKMIKHLVDEIGLNLAGVELSLNIRAGILNMRKRLAPADLEGELGKRLAEFFDEMLEMMGVGQSEK